MLKVLVPFLAVLFSILKLCFRCSNRIIATSGWLMLPVVGTSSAFATDALWTGLKSSSFEKNLVRVASELSAPAQKQRLAITQNGRADRGSVCIRKMDSCYEQCKAKGGEPNACNSTCTTDKICGMNIRIPYGQFLDFQIEMLAAQERERPEKSPAPQNAAPRTNSHPERIVSFMGRLKALLGPRRTSQHTRLAVPRTPQKSPPRPGAATAPSQASALAANRDWLNWSGL
jgi:hypothetical protein